MKSLLIVLILISVSLDFVRSVKYNSSDQSGYSNHSGRSSKIGLSKVKNIKKKLSLFSKKNLQEENNQSVRPDLLDTEVYENDKDGRNTQSKQLVASRRSYYEGGSLVGDLGDLINIRDLGDIRDLRSGRGTSGREKITKSSIG